MSWMNASAAAAADRRNAEWSAWDHSVESPDGYGRRGEDLELLSPTAEAVAEFEAAKAAEAARLEASRAKTAAENAAFEALPGLAEADATEVRVFGDGEDGWAWILVSEWEHRERARVTVGKPSDDWGAPAGRVAKVAKDGFAWLVR
jgi:uncharacterized small protein (DUF1192 family)